MTTNLIYLIQDILRIKCTSLVYNKSVEGQFVTLVFRTTLSRNILGELDPGLLYTHWKNKSSQFYTFVSRFLNL